ncbi:hypothetical protein AV654_26375 [Paenibacillus elgii]|uniref:Translation initiation factor 2 n=1 Tax=Paenibacillus elgii TaxID=189691 RepID=A0A165QMS3_9BACL|nr:hypothetical protein [Paenibacillus elgii]KZE75664.1 hypothetical protein AV654_26375 [Paenibacillus elgii]
MRGNAFVKVGAVGLAMAFCIFFGVALATQGTERIHGPLTKPQAGAAEAKQHAYTSAPVGKPGAASPAGASGAGPVPKPHAQRPAEAKAKPAMPEDPAANTGINRVGNKTGELLQIAAYHGIRFVVSIFEAISP